MYNSLLYSSANPHSLQSKLKQLRLPNSVLKISNKLKQEKQKYDHMHQNKIKQNKYTCNKTHRPNEDERLTNESFNPKIKNYI